MISSSLLLQGDVLRAGLLVLHFLLRAQHQVIDDCDGVDVDDAEMLLLLMTMLIMAMVVMKFSRVTGAPQMVTMLTPDRGKVGVGVSGPKLLFVNCICQEREQ